MIIPLWIAFGKTELFKSEVGNTETISKQNEEYSPDDVKQAYVSETMILCGITTYSSYAFVIRSLTEPILDLMFVCWAPRPIHIFNMLQYFCSLASILFSPLSLGVYGNKPAKLAPIVRFTISSIAMPNTLSAHPEKRPTTAAHNCTTELQAWHIAYVMLGSFAQLHMPDTTCTSLNCWHYSFYIN